MIYENQFFTKIIEAVNNTASTALIIKDIIEANKTRDLEMIALWDRYNGNVAIKSRSFVDPTKPNNKIANDYRGILVQQICGYLLGYPIKYQIDETIYLDRTPVLNKTLQTFLKRNNYEELDYTLENILAVTGKAYRLVYYADVLDSGAKVDEKIELIMKNIKPWEATVIRNPVTDEVEYGLIYYDFFLTKDDGKIVTVKRAEWYDRENVYYFISDEKGNFYEDYLLDVKVQAHQFDFVPVIEFINNNLLKGDFEKVESIIDAMDIGLSDSVNELETFANSYLAFFGAEVDADMLKAAKNSGAFYVPRNSAEDANNDVRFITKDINPTYFSEVINILNDRIWKFSAGVDMSDESFSGAAQTGVSRRYKLFGLEIKAKEKERLYQKSLREMFKVITSFWSKIKNITINYEDIEFIFSRYLPTDLTVQELVMLRGILSDEAILSKLPSDVVPNVKAELEKAKKQRLENGEVFNLDDITVPPTNNETVGE